MLTKFILDCVILIKFQEHYTIRHSIYKHSKVLVLRLSFFRDIIWAFCLMTVKSKSLLSLAIFISLKLKCTVVLSRVYTMEVWRVNIIKMKYYIKSIDLNELLYVRWLYLFINLLELTDLRALFQFNIIAVSDAF